MELMRSASQMEVLHPAQPSHPIMKVDYQQLHLGEKAPEIVNAYIECTSGTPNQYMYDSTTGLLRLARVLASSVFFPGDFGFLPQTATEYDVPLRMLVLSFFPLFPATLVSVRPVGVVDLQEGTSVVHILVGVAAKDPRCAEIKDIEDVPVHRKLEITHFFNTYRDLEATADTQTNVLGLRDRAAALAEIRVCAKCYNEQESS
eukprot:EC724557.1.p1 GENE.EC724557.1~~EC724557.1.p1  ORF type:complete len:203 (+),score=22.26 EC724557.1:53-661(+)